MCSAYYNFYINSYSICSRTVDVIHPTIFRGVLNKYLVKLYTLRIHIPCKSEVENDIIFVEMFTRVCV